MRGLQPCNSSSSSFCSTTSSSTSSLTFTLQSLPYQTRTIPNPTSHKCTLFKTQRFSNLLLVASPLKTLVLLPKINHLLFCSSSNTNGGSKIFSTHVSDKPEDVKHGETEDLELLGKPSPLPVSSDSVNEEVSNEPKTGKAEALAPFMKFFKPRNPSEKWFEQSESDLFTVGIKEEEKEEEEVSNVEYYDPQAGEFVVGVVVSGNENKLDVNIGADLLGTMLTKEVLPLYNQELPYLLCDLDNDAQEFMVKGKMGIVQDEAAMGGEPTPGRPVVETGTILFAEVLGRTLSGRPLLSTRRFFRRVAWHRVRQIKQLNEPIEVRIIEWNTGGLLTRVEGLRAFLPKAELVSKVNNFTELKENVGRRMFVLVTRMDEAKNELILSEREAWEMANLKDGTLLEGTISRILPYGAQVRIGETNRSGLLHISNISRTRLKSINDLLEVDEKVKVLVVKSMFADKISLSIADLESEPGLFLSNKEKVFAEAEEMAKRYRKRLPAHFATHKLDPLPADVLPLDDESKLYSNWKWFKFQRADDLN